MKVQIANYCLSQFIYMLLQRIVILILLITKRWCLLQHNTRSRRNAPYKLWSNQRDKLSLKEIRNTLVDRETDIINTIFARSSCHLKDGLFLERSSIKRGQLHNGMSLEREKICKLIQPASLFKKLVGDENGCVPHQTMLQKATPHLHIKNKCIDICNEILDQYRRKILDNICIPGNDCQYDAALAYDTYLLQNVSARVHTGMLVAEAKFLQNPEVYTRLVKCYNTAGLVSMLTNLAVENEVLSRVFEKSKASHSERARNNTQYGHLLEPNVVVKIYRDFIIPLTKVVEIKYLYQRCGIEPPQQTSFSYLLRPGDAIAEIVLD